MTLAKLTLVATQGEGENIVVMFNPTSLKLDRGVNYDQQGVDGSKGFPELNYKGVEPMQVTIGSIIFDTYESGKNVMTEHVDKVLKAMQPSVTTPNGKRPPTYILSWGPVEYLKCVVEKVGYELTMFLQDGTPVRASVSLTLKEREAPSGW